MISRIESFEEDTGKKLTLANFLTHYHMDAREIYVKFSFARLSVYAGVREDFNESIEETLTKAFSRIVAIDSRRWIEFLLEVLPKLMDIKYEQLTDVQLRMMRMFYITVWQKYMADFDNEEALQNLMSLADSPVMLAELIELLQYRFDQIDFVDEPMDIGFDCPLDVHCTYTARQILTAFDDEKVMSFREGVKWLPVKNTDVFFITLNNLENYGTGREIIGKEFRKNKQSKEYKQVRSYIDRIETFAKGFALEGSGEEIYDIETFITARFVSRYRRIRRVFGDHRGLMLKKRPGEAQENMLRGGRTALWWIRVCGSTWLTRV